MSNNSSVVTIKTAPTVPSAQAQQGITLVNFVSALAASLVVFAIQLLAFLILRNKLVRIFQPKTYLVPEKERTEPPPRSPWGWLFAIFKFRDREIIRKCGLDAYFFSRYLRTLLIIFIPLAVVIIPILIPMNYINGRGSHYRKEVLNSANSTNVNDTLAADVKGLDTLAWGNIRPSKTDRYWAHLLLAILVIFWVCGVFFSELRVYIRVRQDHLTSAEHRLRASATTVLVSAIPKKWLTKETLSRLYGVFPGGIRNIWINRNYDELLSKISKRDYVFHLLESAETELIRMAKKNQRKQAEKDAKTAAKKAKCKLRLTRKDKKQKIKEEDAQAEKLACSGGQSTGDLPNSIEDAIIHGEKKSSKKTHRLDKRVINLHGLETVGLGIGKGLGSVGKASESIIGGARSVGRSLESRLDNSDGFMNIEDPAVGDEHYNIYGHFTGEISVQSADTAETEAAGQQQISGDDMAEQESSTIGLNKKKKIDLTREPEAYYGGDGARDGFSNNEWWQFWKPPPGGFGTPTPAGYNSAYNSPSCTSTGTFQSRSDATDGEDEETSIWARLFPFLATNKKISTKYPVAYNQDYSEDSTDAEWRKYVKPKDRPTYRVPLFSWTPKWIPGIPVINKKVDTIYWCRKELAKLNLEIEMDQKHPEKFPLMNSAFIQFNHQVAAHMASQSVSYHLPKQMTPRTVEVSPRDVLWENMSVKWWEAWLRTSVIVGLVVAMVILWAFPVAWTASLSQLPNLASRYVFLRWLKGIPNNLLQAVTGVLPAIILGILLMLVPMILKYLAFLQGAQTGTEQQGSVQIYYFTFLFIQVFLVVSISGGTFAALGSATNITAIPDTLATQLPKAANYFFSYMILQALSTSSGGLLQIVTLLQWYIWPKIADSTARDKWTRNTTLPSITWGTFFPVYTNFACIALIYSIVAPMIIVFAIITFSLLWIAQRYNMLYVSRFQIDTGGLLYPRAINQTFTGLYVMELCLIGLFFLVYDEKGEQACVPQAIIMIIFIILTALYQLLLNKSFGPLLHHLPITFEHEAVLRDRAFEKAQAQRLGLDYNHDSNLAQNDGAMESNRFQGHKNQGKTSVKRNNNTRSWAMPSSNCLKTKATNHCLGIDESEDSEYLNQENTCNSALKTPRWHKNRRDLEAQRRIADALYGGYNDEIEDLTPEERDVLVKHAFQHSALRARRPTVWIPRDDIGVSDDEIKRTRAFSGKNIWISNVGAALDSKSRVVYGRNPPDFSEVDLINL